MKQLILSSNLKERVIHGGELSVGKRKQARPIATKRAMHLVMRSTQARGNKSFLGKSNASWIQGLALELAKQNHVQIYELANGGNHLHFLLRPRDRQGFKTFLRVFAGLVAMRVGGGKKGSAAAFSFWDLPEERKRLRRSREE